MALRSHLEAQTKSPIAGMPVELLLMVFDPACRPVALSHVCRRCREVALSHPTLWHSLLLAEPPKKALRKAQEWRRRSHGKVSELTIRKSLGGAVLKPLEGDQMVHPSDLLMREETLAQLRRLDLRYVKACHLEDVDVSLSLSSLWDKIYPPNPQQIEALFVSQSSFRRVMPLGESEHGIPSWRHLRVLRISNMECHWPAFTMFVRGLTTFEYKISGSPIDFEPIRSLLQANPTLESLIIGTNTSSLLAHLRHFEPTGVALSLVSTRNLSLPSLQVRLFMFPGSVMVLENLVDDPGTSLAELVELTIKNCDFQTLPFTLALSHSPKLKILQLRGDFDANTIAGSLSTAC